MNVAVNHTKLAIVIPCHNEEGNVAACSARLLPVVDRYDYTLLFVDDGSTDQTLPALKQLACDNPRVQYISLSRNFGQQMALKAGYDHAGFADCVVCLDADLQHPPESIPALVDKWKEGYDVVNGIRNVSGAPLPFGKRVASGLFYRLVNKFTEHTIIPHAPDFRLLDRKVVQALAGFSESGLYVKALIPWMGYRQASVTFSVGERYQGESRYSTIKLISLSIKAFVSGSIAPLRLAIAVGCVFAGLSFCYGFYALYKHLFTDDTVAGWTSIIASVLFIAGIQFLLMGVMGEYLGRTLVESRRRPPYLVREKNVEPVAGVRFADSGMAR
ncbi:glycosyltransferase family 2 protein [Parapedobacter sp. 10938]|uniref:glycosyltransferase family 2 protein n=1 Tax=Parapedobacter flavus TaxID=3110225 RepID=UPI002DB7E5F3|nr:glycosyltransferase family 2 protein [Parapedobacter sp. 10938]MEC3881960.1 glycosyltransferase family 2 protein [Parapedobacter sp. 10938]